MNTENSFAAILKPIIIGFSLNSTAKNVIKENRSACRKKITAQGMKQELFHIKLDKHSADRYNGNRRW